MSDLPGFDRDTMTTAASIGAQVAGVPGGVVSGVNALARSDSFSQLQDSLLSGLVSTAASTAINSALPGIVGAPAMAGSIAAEATKSNPNFSAAATKSGLTTAAGVLGTMVGGPIAGTIAAGLMGYAVKDSLADGWLGDMTDSRKSESKRDAVESAFGVNPSDTAAMSRVDSVTGRLNGLSDLAGAYGGVTDSHQSTASESGYGFGLNDAFGSTALGNISKSAPEAKAGLFGETVSSLQGYLDQLDALAKSTPETSDTAASPSSSSPGVGRIDGHDTAGFSPGAATVGRVDQDTFSKDDSGPDGTGSDGAGIGGGAEGGGEGDGGPGSGGSDGNR